MLADHCQLALNLSSVTSRRRVLDVIANLKRIDKWTGGEGTEEEVRQLKGEVDQKLRGTEWGKQREVCKGVRNQRR